MDFTKRDIRGAAEKAQFVHIKDPITGEPINDDKTGEPVGVMVLGATARTVQARLKEDRRALLASAKDADDAKALEDTQRDMIESASRLTVGFVNVQRGDRDAVAPDDCAWFYDLNMFSVASLLAPKPGEWQNLSFAQQVLQFANDAENFAGND